MIPDKRRAILALFLAVVVLWLGSSSAHAAYSCGISLISVDLGAYNPFDSSPLQATGQLSVTCTLSGGGTQTVSLTASLDKGTYGNAYTSRKMQNLEGNDFLDYRLTKSYDGSCVGTTVWGDADPDRQTATLDLSDAEPSKIKVWNIYGCAPAQQDVSASPLYSDSVTVTVEYLP